MLIDILTVVTFLNCLQATSSVVAPSVVNFESQRQQAKLLFKHAYDNYMIFAFPHDELKPLSHTWTDSLIELGNLNLQHLSANYSGVAMTLIDSMPSLALLGETSEFRWAVHWVATHVSFDIDARVNVFETTIRLLGGLLSSHMLAISNSTLVPAFDYDDELLHLARDLAQRLLPAFEQSPSALPYAWVNLRSGVREGETHEQCVAGIGTLLLEFELLSMLIGDPRFAQYAKRAVQQLWSLRSPSSGLLGNTINIYTLKWIDGNSGIGAGVDR
jgi:mannosidase alpha-like ER degradation enhancer 1